MLKALFLDLDETLCDTTGANRKALVFLEQKAIQLFGQHINSAEFGAAYLKGIYRELDERYAQLLLPVTDEENFRLNLIKLILQDLKIHHATNENIISLQQSFDKARSQCFDFFPGIKELLLELRKRFTLIVITNGPEFSQLAKIHAVNLDRYVDHIIIGGQEKEQKPATSIFIKALRLAQCEKNEAIHIGDSLNADIAGANNTGLVSVWISHGSDLDSSCNITPTHIIESPFQLRDLINTLSNSIT